VVDVVVTAAVVEVDTFSSIGERVVCVVTVEVVGVLFTLEEVVLSWTVVVVLMLLLVLDIGAVPVVAVAVVVKLLNICVNRLGFVDEDDDDDDIAAVDDVVKEESKDDVVADGVGFIVVGFVPILDNAWNCCFCCCDDVVPNNSCISCGVKCGLLCIANAMAIANRISSSSSSAT
jgi:hypothetical protein